MSGYLRIILVLVVMLMISPAVRVYGFGSNAEPGSGFQVIGPAIDAVLTAKFDNGVVTILAVGNCKKNSVAFEFPQYMEIAERWNGFTAADVINLASQGGAPAICFPDYPGEGLVISGVTKFNNTGVASGVGYIGANIQISVLKPK